MFSNVVSKLALFWLQQSASLLTTLENITSYTTQTNVVNRIVVSSIHLCSESTVNIDDTASSS